MKKIVTKDIIKEYRGFFLMSVLAVIILLFCDGNSFIYKRSLYPDAGIYYNIAKGMLQGKILYVDLYDHKGPFIYFVYMIYNILFPSKLYGAYIANVICYILINYFVYKIGRTRYSKFHSIILMTAHFLILVKVNSSFGCPEIFAVLLEVVILYWVIKQKCNDYKYLVFFGLATGILLMTKITLAAFPFVMFLWFLYENIINKVETKQILRRIIVLIGSMLIPIAISIIYLVQSGSVNEFIEVYFLANSSYASIKSAYIIEGIILELVIVFLYLHKKIDVSDIIIGNAFTIMFLFILFSNIDWYALLPIVPFFVFLIIKILKNNNQVFFRIVFLASLLGMIGLLGVSIKKVEETNSGNYAIAEPGDIVLLCVNAEVFNESQKAPDNKYFFMPNFSYKQNIQLWNEMARMVLEAKPDNIYVKCDGKKLYALKYYEISGSMNKVNEMISDLKKNYEYVEQYDDNICKWSRKNK